MLQINFLCTIEELLTTLIMKRSLQILLCFILLNVCRPSNAQVFTENFDGSTISMFTGGTPGYSTTNAYSQSLPNSMLGLFNVNGEATLTSPDFSTLGNQYVTLQFNHICKIDFYDSCVVELSINSGVTWTQLNSATCTYLGTSPNFALVKKFSSASYPTVWDPNNAGTMSNTWWKQELFDISNLCGNQPSVRFRYRMKDATINGMG